MAKPMVRVPGGGNTYVTVGYDGKSDMVEFLAQFQDTPGSPQGSATQIHPIGSPYPVEIVTPYAQQRGQLTFTVWQTWGKDGWVSAFMKPDATGSEFSDSDHSPWAAAASGQNRFQSKSGGGKYPVDLKEVFEAQRKLPGFLTVKKWELDASGGIARVKTYHKCVITDIQAGETVRIGDMESQVTITMQYTRMTVTNNPGDSVHAISLTSLSE